MAMVSTEVVRVLGTWSGEIPLSFGVITELTLLQPRQDDELSKDTRLILRSSCGEGLSDWAKRMRVGMGKGSKRRKGMCVDEGMLRWRNVLAA